MHNKLQRSKDIDIVLDYGQFRPLSFNFQKRTNQSLRGCEIKFQSFDIEAYTLIYLALSVSPQDLLNNYRVIETIMVLSSGDVDLET